MRFLLAALLALSMAGPFPVAAPAADNPPRAGKASSDWADVIGDRIFAGWVEKHVQGLQLTAQDRRFDDIGWVKDIRDALRLAKKHGRPVFLFTHDGRMAIGRC